MSLALSLKSLACIFLSIRHSEIPFLGLKWGDKKEFYGATVTRNPNIAVLTEQRYRDAEQL